MISKWLKNKQIFQYLVITFSFSWFFWISAWLIAEVTDSGDILINADLADTILRSGNSIDSGVLALSILSLLGVYGPLVGAYFVSRKDPEVTWKSIKNSIFDISRLKFKWFQIIFAILGIVILPTLLLTAVISEVKPNAPTIIGVVGLVVVFFLIQLITSGLEEIGWRGYLLEKVKAKSNFWDVGWNSGFIWAVWHYPIVTLIFVQQGVESAAILGSLAGFTMGIVAMSILQTWFKFMTGSLFVNIFIHALFNAIPLVLSVVFIDSPAAILSNLLLWVVVIYLQKKYSK